MKLSLSLFLVCCHYYNGVGTQARAVCECVQNAKFLKLQNSQYCYSFVFLICLRYKINGLIVSVFQLCTKVSGSIINLTISLTLHFKSVVLSDECANSQSLYITLVLYMSVVKLRSQAGPTSKYLQGHLKLYLYFT